MPPLRSALVWLLLGAPTVGAQSSDAADPASPALAELLVAPPDPEAYFETSARARELVAAGRLADAEPLAERLTREYPRDGRNWQLLGRAKAAASRPAEAVHAFGRAGELLGWRSPYHYAGVRRAVSRLAAGDRAGALAELREELSERRNFYIRSAVPDWPGLEPLRDDPEFREIVGRPSVAGLSRDAGWRFDIDWLYREVRRVNPDYHAAPFPAEFTRRYEALLARVPTLSDEEIFVGMNGMLAVLRQGHLSVFPPARNRRLPVQLYAFPEGVFIVDAAAGHEALVGARVVAVGGTPVDTVLRRLGTSRSVSGELQHAWGVSELASTFHLAGVRAIRASDTVSLTVAPRAGAPRVVRLATLGGPAPRRQDKLLAPRGVAAPLFLRDADQSHWEVALPEHDAVYVQVNQVRPDPDETLAQFGVRLRGVLDERKPRNLVLDLRHNNGGATGLYPELLRTVVAFSTRPGTHVYVLIGRRVFSAAANLVTDLERLANPVFVGEPTSQCCSFAGDPNAAVLPYSRLATELTSVRWNLSRDAYDGRREMVPDVPVQLTAEAYFAGRDPALDAVFGLIAARTPSR